MQMLVIVTDDSNFKGFFLTRLPLINDIRPWFFFVCVYLKSKKRKTIDADIVIQVFQSGLNSRLCIICPFKNPSNYLYLSSSPFNERA